MANPTPTPDRPPLWRVIENCDAFMPVHGLLRRRLIAVLIRAMRDWLVPEEPEPDYQSPDITDAIRWASFFERQHLRAILTVEADRAESGDD